MPTIRPIPYVLAATLLSVSFATAQLRESTWYNNIPIPPAAPQSAQVANDPVSGSLIVVRDDATTWSWNGTTLTFLAGPGGGLPNPSPRQGAYVATVDQGGLRGVLLFGGRVNGTYLNDTWLFANGAWTQLFPLARPVPGRDAGAATSLAGRPMIYGGANAVTQQLFQETWFFDVLASGQTTWTLNPPSAQMPPANPLATMCASAGGTVVLHTPAPGQTTQSHVFVNGSWSPLPAGGPPAVPSTTAYDPIHDQAVLAMNFASQDTWIFDFTAQVWFQDAPTVGLAPLSLPGSLGFDGVRRELVRFADTASIYSVAETVFAIPQPASCGNPLLLLSGVFTPSAPPRIGNTLTVDVFGGAATSAGNVMFLATGNTPAVPPGIVGPGCALFFTNLIQLNTAVGSGLVTFSLPIPNNPAFIGFVVDQQAIEASATAFVGVSNDLRITIGR